MFISSVLLANTCNKHHRTTYTSCENTNEEANFLDLIDFFHIEIQYQTIIIITMIIQI